MQLYPVKNMVIRSATDGELPITHRALVNMTADCREFNNQALVYVVSNTGSEMDINCDIIIGRNTTGRSLYPFLDTAYGRLYNRKCEDYVQCFKVKRERDATGRSVLVRQSNSVSGSVSNDAGVDAIMSITLDRGPVQRRPLTPPHSFRRVLRSTGAPNASEREN